MLAVLGLGVSTARVEAVGTTKTPASKVRPSNNERYAAELKSIFAAQGVPQELVWVAEVESAFNPRARSGMGAAGLFQIMPATATSLGLSTARNDQRLNPAKNAAAAAKYLKYLHGRFRDWRLALSAYNCGETRLQSLITRHKTSSFEGLASRLPPQTREYVDKCEGILLAREGVRLHELAAPK